jgi:hypothetical protein
MNKAQLYDHLCSASFNGHGGIAGYLKRNLPKDFKRVSAELGERFKKDELYCYLKAMEYPKCSNPNCKRRAKFRQTFEGGFFLFCSGLKCSRPLSLKKSKDAPIYSEEVLSTLREVKEVSRPSGYAARNGLMSWLSPYLKREHLVDIAQHLGYSFDQKKLYDFLSPLSRRTCSLEGCNNDVTFDSGRLAYRSFCSVKCSGYDPNTAKTRATNWLKRTNGKYSNCAQLPEIRKRNSELSRTENYQRKRRQNALKKSKGKYIHHMQDPSAISKHKRKTFGVRLIKYHGRKWKLQGYEDVALRILIDTYGIDPLSIEVPQNCFRYDLSKDKFRVYYPDLKLVGKNRTLYVEVKSGWTAGYDISTNQVSKVAEDKMRAVVRDGGSILMLLLSNVKGKRDYNPRHGEIVRYLAASPSCPNFSIRTSKRWLAKMFEKLFGDS